MVYFISLLISHGNKLKCEAIGGTDKPFTGRNSHRSSVAVYRLVQIHTAEKTLYFLHHLSFDSDRIQCWATGGLSQTDKT